MSRFLTLSFVVLSLMLIAVPAFADHERQGSYYGYGEDQIVVDLEDLERKTVHQERRMMRNLREMERLAAQLPPCQARDELLRTLRESKRLTKRMKQTDEQLVFAAQTAAEQAWGQRDVVQPRQGRGHAHRDDFDRGLPGGAGWNPWDQVTSDDDFNRLLAAIDKQVWDREKHALLMEVSAQRMYSAAQARRLVDLFTFSDAKVNAAAFLHRKVVDPADFYLVYEALTFPSDRAELRRRING